MMHFPELWEEDSLLFDDTAERELLLRQFQELIGEISSDEGYDIDSEADPLSIFQNVHDEKGKLKDTRNELDLPSIFSSPNSHQPHSIRDWQVDRGETFNRELLAEVDQGKSVLVNDHQRTRRYDVPVDPTDELSPPGHLLKGSPPRTEDSSSEATFGMLSLCHPSKPGAVGIVKLPDGNYYMAMSGSSEQSPRSADCNEGMLPSLASTSKSVTKSRRCDPSITPSVDSLSKSVIMRGSGGRTGHFTPRRLFPPNKNSRKTNAIRATYKRTKTYPYQPNPPRYFPHPKNEIPQDIMKDLEVIRIHRRSSYADGDSLVEVQPSSLPGSPTMFAYRDPEGGLRVPLDMTCNQQALATYKCMTPSTTAAPKIISVSDVDVTQRQTPTQKGTILKETLSSDSQSHTLESTFRTEVIHQRTPEVAEATVNNRKDYSLTKNIVEEWEKLRQHI